MPVQGFALLRTNETTGALINRSELMNNSMAALQIVQLGVDALGKSLEANITGVYEGWSFRDWVPNPDALFLQDPAKAAVTLDGYNITVFGPKDSSTDYSIHDGNYYPSGSNKPVDQDTLNGSEFQIAPSCKTNQCS
jgi:hypothetical protein